MDKQLLDKIKYLVNKSRTVDDLVKTLDVEETELMEIIDSIGAEICSCEYGGQKKVSMKNKNKQPFVVPYDKSCLKMLVYGDTHLSSSYDTVPDIEEAFEYAYKHDADLVIHCGDLAEGKLLDDDDPNIIKHHKMEEQMQYIAEVLPHIRRPHLLLGGNHDKMWNRDGKDAMNYFCSLRDDIVFLGYQKRDIIIGPLKIHINHGDSMTQEVLEKGCMQASKNYVDRLKNPRPDMFFRAHSHKAFYTRHNNTDIFQIPALVGKLPYFKYYPVDNVSGFWWIEVEMNNEEILDVSQKLKVFTHKKP